MLLLKIVRPIRILLTVLIIFIAPNIFADSTDEQWTLQIAPYLWALNMNGDVGAGPLTAHLDQSFSDVLRELNGAGMLWLDARHNKVDLFLNSLYAVLSDDKNVRGIKVDARNKFGLFTAGIAYRMFEIHDWFQLEPYVGARYTLNDTKVKIGNISVTDNQSWSDPIVGARLNFIFNQNWLAIIAADGGGLNGSDWSYNTNAFIGYTPTVWQNLTLYLGYRLLHQYYETGNGLKRFYWNMNLFGPVAGLAFRL